MRPRGSFGEVGRALLQSAQDGPGTVSELAERACVGYGAARYTASRLVSAGALAPMSDSRPMVLGLPPAMPPCGDELGTSLQMLQVSFWSSGPSEPGDTNEFFDFA